MDEEQLMLLQKYIANIAISGSTLRNQGAKGVVKKARHFLAQLNLMTFLEIEPRNYSDLLNEWTEDLGTELPTGAQNWGTARKALNVFLVQMFMNKYLAELYGLSRFDEVLETPLDSQAARKLRRIAGRGNLPRWDSIRKLTIEDSQNYQIFAKDYARQQGIPRACLDILLWRSDE